MSDEGLMDLYRVAVFEVDTDEGRIQIALGEHNTAVDALLARRYALGGWAFITAWNPGDERPTTAENEQAQALLEAQCHRAGLRVWQGDGASPDRIHVEPSILVAPIDLASASAIGRAFRQRAIVVGAVGGPASLVDLAVDDQFSGGLPIAHASGQSIVVEALHLTDPFAGWIEGGPDGRRLRDDLYRTAAETCGVPVHLRLPSRLRGDVTSHDVATMAPRVQCVARVHQAGDGLHPTARWTVAWLTDVVGAASLEELLGTALSDAPLLPDLLEGESILRATGSGTRHPRFHDVTLQSRDGVAVDLDGLHLDFGHVGMSSTASVTSVRDETEVPVVLASLESGHVTSLPGVLEVPAGSVVMRLSLVAGPVHHDERDMDAWWRSRLVVVAAVEPGALPLQTTLQHIVATVPWRSLAIDRDETP